MSAIGAFSAIGVERRVGKNGGIILFRFRGAFIGQRLINLFPGIVAAQDRAYRRTGQGVMNTLRRGQAYAEGGALRIEQPASGKALHDGYADVVLLADAIQLRAVGVDSLQAGVVFFREHCIDVLAGGQHIKRRIDAEEDHLHIAGFRRFNGDFRVMRADADMADYAAVFQLHNIVQIFGMLNLLPFFFGIHIVNHAQIDIIRLQTLQQVFKGGTDIFHLSRAEILRVLPGGADVPLNVPLAAVFSDAVANDIPRLRIGHPAVQDVDSLRGRITDQVDAFRLRVTLQPFSAESDFAHLQPCFSQSSEFHLFSSFTNRDLLNKL